MISDGALRWADPSTWPWMVYVWLAYILAGWAAPLWRWLQRRRASGWPVANGRIESIRVTKSPFSVYFQTRLLRCATRIFVFDCRVSSLRAAGQT
jgi:hypothetical protein